MNTRNDKRRFNPPSRRSIYTVAIIFSVAFSFFAGYFFHSKIPSGLMDFPLTREVYFILKDKGSSPLPTNSNLEYGMIRGMLQALGDPYNAFYEPPQTELLGNQLDGRFGGIGIRLEKNTDGSIHLFPLPNSPASRAGLIDGDFLKAIDGFDISTASSLDQIQAAIRGPIGTTVSIKAARASKIFELSVVREEVSIPSVTFNLSSFDPTVGVIQMNIVASSTASELITAINSLSDQGAKRFILDLRNNGGGLVDSAAEVIRLFSPKGPIFFEQLRSEGVRTFTAENEGAFSNLPLAVVVNQNTGSSAEIIAGMLQQTGKFKLIGTRTLGKDSIQIVYPLRDGSSLHVTAGLWWLPGKAAGFTDGGIIPDVVLADESANSAAALEEAAKVLANP